MIPLRPYTVICLTPVRNEAWVLPAFLAAASLWADVIIISDQGSTDGSREIVRLFPKVRLLHNETDAYDEAARQKQLIAAAREYHGPRILLALDADEFLSPELADESWFNRIMDAGPGAHARVPFFNVKPGLRHGWTGHVNFIAAWLDNGRAHNPVIIHSPRLPVEATDPIVVPDTGAAVMHWQFVAPARMCSKHRWYMVWERLNRPEQSAITIYRNYHHMYAVHRRELRTVPFRWLEWYKDRGVVLEEARDDGRHWWDADVLAQMAKSGAGRFSREAIWAYDWHRKAIELGIEQPHRFCDARTILEKWVHGWLRWTQPWSRSFFVRAGDKVIRLTFDKR